MTILEEQKLDRAIAFVLKRIDENLEKFTEIAKQGKDVVYISCSSALVPASKFTGASLYDEA